MKKAAFIAALLLCVTGTALAAAASLGFDVRHVNGTGEVQVSRPGRPPLRLNCRKKDAPRRLLTLLRGAA